MGASCAVGRARRPTDGRRDRGSGAARARSAQRRARRPRRRDHSAQRPRRATTSGRSTVSSRHSRPSSRLPSAWRRSSTASRRGPDAGWRRSLGHPSEVVRFYVVRLLGRYPELARRHVAALTADPSPHVRAAALETLRAAGSADALRQRARAALDDTQPFVRAQASRTAVAIAGAGAASFVAPLARGRVLVGPGGRPRGARRRRGDVGDGRRAARGRRRPGSAQGRRARAAGRRARRRARRRRRGQASSSGSWRPAGPACGARPPSAPVDSARQRPPGDAAGAGVVTFEGVLRALVFGCTGYLVLLYGVHFALMVARASSRRAGGAGSGRSTTWTRSRRRGSPRA